MKEKFQKLLEDIKKDLIFLANEVEHNIRQSIKALKNKDMILAQQIIERDNEIDRKEVEIEDKILTLLALQQPVAIDLRFIVSGLKMNNDLERIGDHAANIAKVVIHLNGKALPSSAKEIYPMSDLACKMLHDAVSAFIHRDTELARQVFEADNEVDSYYEKIIVNTVKELNDKAGKLEEGFAVARVSRFLERVGDLATNIGEDVVFMKEAKIIRHSFHEEDEE